MDCEKFDQNLIDALYDELDEVTFAAMRRHMEGCSRCAEAFSRLRATRDVGVLPLEEPSDELEGKILAAAQRAQRKTSWPRKALRGLAWAGSHAMRPQLAMAALFVLVIGSSLLLLRPKPASMPTPVRVTERGVPASDQGDGAPAAVAAAAPQATAAPATPAVQPSDLAAEAQGSSAAKAKESEERAYVEGGNDAKAALAEARAVRQKSGCGAAVKAYNDVGARFPATVSAGDAMWEAAECYKSMGDSAKARELYFALRSFSAYRDRAEQELGDALGNTNNMGTQVAAKSAGGGYLPKSAAAAPAPVAAAKPAGQAMEAAKAPPPATAPAGSPGNARPAAPARSQATDAAGF